MTRFKRILQEAKKHSENQGAFSHGILEQSAWHGSPHIFDYFSLDAIGTGEGAQAHGWGLYFAKEREVGEGYKNWLTERQGTTRTLLYDGKEFSEAPAHLQVALHEIAYYEGDIEYGRADNLISDLLYMHEKEREGCENLVEEYDRPLALYEENPKVSIKALRASVEKYSNVGHAIDNAPPAKEGDRRTAADVVRKLRKNREEIVGRIKKEEAAIRSLHAIDPEKLHLDVDKPVGRLFEVEIPDDDVLLDEQLDFSKQPEGVKQALQKIVDDLTDEQLGRWNRPQATREETIAFIKTTFAKSTGRDIYGMLRALTGSKKDASLLLNEYGIKGITYDGRQDGRCYVIFDDEAIEVIKHYEQAVREEVKGKLRPSAGDYPSL